MKKLVLVLIVFLFLFTSFSCNQSKIPNLIAVSNQKYGFLSYDGQVAIPFEYDELRGFYDNGLACAKKEGLYGFINVLNETIIPFEYENVTDFDDNLVVFAKKDGKWGVIDSDGEVVIPFSYNSYKEEFNNYFIVKLASAWGIIDINNNIIGDFIYQDLIYIENNIFGFQKDNLWGYLEIDKNGQINETIPAIYTSIGKFNEGLATVSLNNKYGYIDYLGEVVIDFLYDQAINFFSGFAAVCLDGFYGAINRKNENHLPFIYDSISLLKNAEYCLIKDGIHAITDLRFNIIINDTFSHNISEIGLITTYGLLAVSIDNKFGIISKRNNLVIDPLYDGVSYNRESNIFAVKENNSWGVIDSRGFLLINPVYDAVTIINNDLVIVNDMGKVGILSRNNQLLTKIEFDNIYLYNQETITLT